MDICEHNWVATSKIDVDQCYGAICEKCGKIGCACDYFDQHPSFDVNEFLQTQEKGNEIYNYYFDQKL